jgi:hypothetical protein
VEMEESRQTQQTQPSIHPSIHTIGLLRSTIVTTSLMNWDSPLLQPSIHPFIHSHNWVVEINNCDDIPMNWDNSLIEMDEMVEGLHPYELGQVGHYEFFDMNQMVYNVLKHNTRIHIHVRFPKLHYK